MRPPEFVGTTAHFWNACTQLAGLVCETLLDINGQPSWKGDFSMLGALAKHHKLIWGGDWGTPGSVHTFVDTDHVQRVTLGRQARLFNGDWYPDANYDPYADLK